MKKKLLLLIAGFSLSLSISAQTLFVPAGANGIGASSNGNVGIGTATPSEKLTIGGSHGDTKLRLYSTGNGSDEPSNLSLWASEPGWTYYGTGIGYNVNGSPYYGRIDNTRGSSYLRFLPGETKFEFQNTSGNYIKAITIKDNGNIGINAENPIAKLQINSGANNQYAAILATSNEGNNLVVSSLDTQPLETAVFKISHEYSNDPNNRNNGYISFHRGTSINGGFLEFGSNGLERLRIDTNGNVGIGTTNPAYKLDVLGTIRAKEVLVNLDGGADFVFEKGYKLLPIEHVADYVQENKHLPDIPSANEMVKNGVNMGDMQVKLLQKVEELTLYVIELKKEINQQNIKINELSKQ